MLQAKDVTIALAVISIYAVDFAINVGKYLIRDSMTILTIVQFKRAVEAWSSIHYRSLCNKLDQLGVSLVSSCMSQNKTKTMKLVEWQPLGISWAMR